MFLICYFIGKKKGTGAIHIPMLHKYRNVVMITDQHKLEAKNAKIISLPNDLNAADESFRKQIDPQSFVLKKRKK